MRQAERPRGEGGGGRGTGRIASEFRVRYYDFPPSFHPFFASFLCPRGGGGGGVLWVGRPFGQACGVVYCRSAIGIELTEGGRMGGGGGG